MNRWRSFVVVTVIGLVAAACGRSGSSTTATTTASTTATTAAASAAGPGDFGTLKAVCGPGNAKGTTDQGVTDTTIDVGTMADPGNTAVPRLDQELFDTSTAFVKWCNDAGGILGRKIVDHLRDAKLFEVAARTIDACAQDFAEVGGGTALDDAGVDQRIKCKLPEVNAYVNSPKAVEAPLKVQAATLPIEEQVGAQYRGFQHSFPGLTRAGFLVGNLPGVIVSKDRFKEAATKLGFTSVYDETYPVTGVDNPQSYVQRMKAANVEVLDVVGQATDLVSIEKAMQTIGWYPQAIVESANLYDPQLYQLGGQAIKNTWIVDSFYPFEAAGQNPPTQQYLDIMHKDDPGGKIAALGLNSWDAWLLFATAARDCGSNLTRTCLLQQAGSHSDWTAGGLASPGSTDPINRHATECYLFLKANPTGFSVDNTFLPPNQGAFNCDPANVVKLTGNYKPA